MGEAMETESITPQPTLDPWEYDAWIRSIERKMLGCENASERPTYIPDLLRAMQESLHVMALRPRDWHIYLSVHMMQGELDVHQMCALHQRSVRDTFDMSLFVRCASFWLCAWMCHTRSFISLELSGTPTDADGAPYNVTQLVEAWTGLSSPNVLPCGMYDPAHFGMTLDLDEHQVRDSLRELYSQCAWHLSESCLIWDLYMAFEQALLESDPSDARVQMVKQAFIARLQVPHQGVETTFQRLSSFVSTYLPASEYEPVMSSANRAYAETMDLWRLRESFEERIAMSNDLHAHWYPYLAWQTHRIKQMRTAKDKSHLSTEEELGFTLYRRAIHRFGSYPTARNAEESASHANVPPTPDIEKRWKQAQGRKSHKLLETERERARVEVRPLVAVSEGLWLDFLALLSTPTLNLDALLALCSQAVSVLPLSGRLWAVYLRAITRCQRPKSHMLALYEKAAHSRGVALLGGASLLSLLQARIDCERAYAAMELAHAQKKSPDQVLVVTEMDHFMHVYELFLHSISAMQRLPASEQDASVALERCAVDWIERAARALAQTAGLEASAGLYPLADDVWTHALEQHPMHATAYLEAAQYFQRRDDDKRARQTYKAAVAKQGLDNKASIVAAWVAFEHARGSPADIEQAEAKAKVEQDRLWRQWYRYQAQEPAAAPESAPESEVPKRKSTHEEHEEEAAPPKRLDAHSVQPARDREFSSVLVSGMPPDVSEGDVRAFFRDCGIIFDMIGPRSLDDATSAALIEFTDRDSAGAARTRDKKLMGHSEISVVLSYQCTLYVTNFPPDASDALVRERFSKYGPIFDVRWPSRRFIQSRRFCYIQFATADAARAALAEHGALWHADHALQVFLSNPQHKKQRSDANANEKELYVAGLPRSATVEQVRQFFLPHTHVEDVRMPLRPDGKARGIAFIQCRTPLDARRAMQATNSTKFHGRLIAVTMADAGRSSKNSSAPEADRRARTIHVAGLPPDAQEALIQQAIEMAIGPETVRRVFWTPGRPPNSQGLCDSMVEMVDEEAAGRAVLSADVTYGTMPLALSMYQQQVTSSTSAATSMRDRRRGALGFARVHSSESTDTTPKGQDAFRQMLHP